MPAVTQAQPTLIASRLPGASPLRFGVKPVERQGHEELRDEPPEGDMPIRVSLPNVSSRVVDAARSPAVSATCSPPAQRPRGGASLRRNC